MSALVRRVAGSDFARNGTLVFGAVLAGNVVNYVYYMLLGRTLSVPDYGIVMSLISVVMVVFGVGTVAQTVAAKLGADLRAAGDVERMASYARAISRLAVLVAVAITVLAFASQRFVAGFLQLDDPELVTVAGATAGLGFALLMQRGVFQGFGTFGAYGVSSVLDGVRAVIVVPLALAFGVMGSIVAMLAAYATSMCYGAYALRGRYGTAGTAARLDVRRMLATAGATGISSLGIVVLMFYDVVLARHFLDHYDAGLYGAMALAGRVLITAVSFLPTILLPDVALRAAAGRSGLGSISVALGAAVAIIAAIAVACGIAPEWIVRILAGPHFTAAAPLVLPYVLASGALAVANLLSMYAIARHRFGYVPYLVFVAACEIVAVSVRHGSAGQVVEDILAGHVAVCGVMLVWLALTLAKRAAPARIEPATRGER